MSPSQILRFAIANRPWISEALVVTASLPEDIDERLASLAADVVLIALSDAPLVEYKELTRIPLVVLDRVLSSPKLPRAQLPVAFLEAMTEGLTGEAKRRAWEEAFSLLHRLRARPAASASLRKDVSAVAARAEIVDALARAAERASTLEPSSMAAVLAAHGGESARRALAAHIGRDRGEMDALARTSAVSALWAALRFAAKTPEMDALARELAAADEAEREQSAGARLLRALGLPDQPLYLVVKFDAPHADARILVHIESSRASGVVFSVRCEQGSSATRFDAEKLTRDELEVGRCDVLDLPSWIRAAGDRLNVTWSLEVLRLSLRGAARRVLLDWLTAGRVP